MAGRRRSMPASGRTDSTAPWWASSSAGLRDIAHDALEPFGVLGGRTDRIVITGENIRFPPKAALALSIAFNELATNAVKYEALSNAVGSILIGWTMEMAPAGKRLLLNWTEKGGPRSRRRPARDLDLGCSSVV
jgi:two-component sensor histidine kinase